MNRIKELRIEKGWTQSQLGKALNVKDSAISKYESERIPITAETIKKISELFNVTTDYILCLSDFPNEYTKIVNTTINLTQNEQELLDIFNKVTNERDQIKLIGRFDEIVEQVIGDFKSGHAPSTRSKKIVG